GRLRVAAIVCAVVVCKLVAGQLGAESLGGKLLVWMIIYLVYNLIGGGLLVSLFCGGMMAAAGGGGDAEDVGARMGAMMVVMWILTLVNLAVLGALFAWYVVLMQHSRGTISA